jgi:sigma-B regulation protein RsbU (phosphoserine phosphatase)
VGGDFYDVFPVEKGCTALVVGDLSGKGLAAASEVATVRNMVRYAIYSGRTLAEAITDLDRILVEHNLLTGFATLFVGLYDQNERLLTYVNCGQEPGLIWRSATGAVESLLPTGPVLGGFESMGGYEEATVALAPGDMLALFTDGMTEVGPNRREFLEIEGLTELFARCCATTASVTGYSTSEAATVVRDSLIAAVEAYAGSGSGTGDDIALLVGAAAAPGVTAS